MDTLREADGTLRNIPKQVLPMRTAAAAVDESAAASKEEKLSAFEMAALGFRDSSVGLEPRRAYSQQEQKEIDEKRAQQRRQEQSEATDSTIDASKGPPKSTDGARAAPHRRPPVSASGRFASLSASRAGVGGGFGYSSVVGVRAAGPDALVSAEGLKRRLLERSTQAMGAWQVRAITRGVTSARSGPDEEQTRPMGQSATGSTGRGRRPFQSEPGDGNEDEDVDVDDDEEEEAMTLTEGALSRQLDLMDTSARSGAKGASASGPGRTRPGSGTAAAAAMISDRGALGMPLLDPLAAETLLP